MKLIASLTERTTAATDIILSGVAAGLTIYLQVLAHHPPGRITLWSWSFIFIAVSAGCGAAYHGLSLSELTRRLLWQGVTLCMGMAISLFVVAVLHDIGGPQTAESALPIMLAAGGIVYALSRMRPGLFVVFIIYEALALLIAFAAYIWLAVSGTLSGARWLAAGVAVSLIAAALQPIRRLRVVFLWELDRNGLFHLAQVIGLILLCVGLVQS
jgi:hypothetical protein